jgi:hypothetical protein
MAVVVFDPTAFLAEYPEFNTAPNVVSDARANSMFLIASTTLLDNTDNGPVMDLTQRTQLFYLLVAHLLLLYGTSDTPMLNNAPPGRISSATEGTVSSQFEYQVPQGSAMMAWFLQTKYGALYWTATAAFRSSRYFGVSSGVGYAKAYGAPYFNIPGGV